MAGTLERRSPPLVVDLRRRDVPMTKQLLDLGNIDAEIQQPGGTRRPQAMGRVDALAVGSLFRLDRLHRPRQTLQIAHEDQVHGVTGKMSIGQLCAVSRSFARAEEGTTRDLSHLDVLSDRRCGLRMNADRATFVTFLSDPDHRRVFLVAKVTDIELAGGPDTNRTEQKQFDEGSIVDQLDDRFNLARSSFESASSQRA